MREKKKAKAKKTTQQPVKQHTVPKGVPKKQQKGKR